MTTQKTSDFYWACRNGDIGTIKKILTNIKLIDINRIESNGSTALHAASFYGHASIVRLLLRQGADINIRNKYEKTAEEEASTDEVRAVFEASKEVKEADDDDDIPESKFGTLYPNSDGADKSQLATKILKARLGTHQAYQYTIAAKSNLEYLEKKYRKECEVRDKHEALRQGERCFKEYRKTGDFSHIIQLITNDTPFCGMIQTDETFFVEVCKHLLGYENYRFKGHTYTVKQLPPEHFQLYHWALRHPKCLLETHEMTETSRRKEVVRETCLRLNGNHERDPYVFFHLEFANQCFTALDVQSFSMFLAEEEVHVFPGTFFEVTQIRKDSQGVTNISLKNVPVNAKMLCQQ